MKNTNSLLKFKCVELGISEKRLADEMHISESQFNRKVNQRKIGGSYSTFTFCEKFYIADRLKMKIKDIE